jgi:hypothetical protein
MKLFQVHDSRFTSFFRFTITIITFVFAAMRRGLGLVRYIATYAGRYASD